MKKVTGPLFKWFGSKWLSSKTLPPPRHDTLVETFAGGAGYALRHCEKRVVLCERDPNIAELWRWLIEQATDAAVREIPLGLPVGTDIRTIGLARGQELLLKTWQRTNNVGNCWTVSPWGDKPGQWTANTRARVADQLGAVKHWRFLSNDGFEAFDAVHEDATWFVDPPYQFNYAYGQPPIDYARLAASVLSRRDHVIVCEGACKKTGRVPTWLPFASFGMRVTSRRGADKHHHGLELLWESPAPGSTPAEQGDAE